MDWPVLILLIPVTIMALVLWWSFRQKNDPKRSPAELLQKFRRQQIRIEIGIGIFSLLVFLMFAVDAWGPSVQGTGKLLAPVEITAYQLRFKSGLPFNFPQEAVLLQRWGDRNNYTFVNSEKLWRAMLADSGETFDVDFEQTFLLGNVTNITLNGETISVAAGNLTTMGLLGSGILVLLGLGGNHRRIRQYFLSRRKDLSTKK